MGRVGRRRRRPRPPAHRRLVGSDRRGGGAAVAAAVVLGLLAWWSGSTAGPGRLADVGPAPLDVAGIAAATVGIGALVGGYAARLRGRDNRDPGASGPADAAMAGAFDR